MLTFEADGQGKFLRTLPCYSRTNPYDGVSDVKTWSSCPTRILTESSCFVLWLYTDKLGGPLNIGPNRRQKLNEASIGYSTIVAGTL